MAKEKEQQEEKKEDQPKVLPTPEIGDHIWWYSNGDLGSTPYAGICTAQEAPGRITATILSPSKPPVTHRNLVWVGHHDHKQRRYMTSYGAFDFRFNKTPPNAYNYHRGLLKAAEDKREQEELRLRKEKERKQRIQQEQAEAAAYAAQQMRKDSGLDPES